MRRVLGGVAAAVLALTAVPALAAEEEVPAEPELLAPCTLPAGATALTADGFEGTITTPSFVVGNERESRVFVLDLAGSPVGTTAGIASTLTWLVPANDYDLELQAGRASSTSENYQPFDPAEESVFATGVAHCTKVTLTAVDFLAPAAVDTLDLGVVVTPKLPA